MGWGGSVGVGRVWQGKGQVAGSRWMDEGKAEARRGQAPREHTHFIISHCKAVHPGRAPSCVPPACHTHPSTHAQWYALPHTPPLAHTVTHPTPSSPPTAFNRPPYQGP